MIWCDGKFVVCSIPRTGTDIKSYLASGIVDDGCQRRDHAKHGSLSVRWRGGMVAALTFRSLSTWLLSFVGMAHEDGLHPTFGKSKMPWPRDTELFCEDFGRYWLSELQGSLAGLGDRYLDFMTDGGRIYVDRFIRSEYVVEDMIIFLHDMGVDFREDDLRYRGRRYHPRKRPLNYVKDPLHYWSVETLARVAELNPRWTEIEQRIYT